MEMEDVKGVRLLKHLLEEHNMVCQLIHALLIQAQGARTCGYQTRLGDRIPTGKQGDLMALLDECFCEV